MSTFLVCLPLGLLLVILGAVNMTGNISSVHHYHRKRVSEENRKPFGRLVGFGTLLVGASLICFGALMLVYEAVQSLALLIVATVLLSLGILVGLGISFVAMFKYNGGIF